MRSLRTRQVFDLNVSANASGLTGSARAGSFLRDLINGVDSVDIITIGDSNALQPAGYGYHVGWHRALGMYAGATMYATPLLPGGYFLNSTTFANLFPNAAPLVGCRLVTSLNGEASGGSLGGTMRQMVRYTGDTAINACATALGFDSTNFGNDGTTMLLKPNVWQWTPCALAAGEQWTSPTGNTNAVWVNKEHPIAYGTAGTGTQLLQYRLVYGTFATGSGAFKLSVFNQSGFSLNQRSSYISTNTGTAGYSATPATIDFTTATTAVGGDMGVYCSWDGANQGAGNAPTGPFAALWMSVAAKNRKGYSVSNLTGHGGLGTGGLADRVEGCDKVLDSFLKEIRDRQMMAGGSGRAIVWLNSGINGPDTSSTWIAGAERIRNRIAARWQTIGGSISNLAFVMSVTHPTTSVATWDSARAAVASGANDWAIANANNGYGVSVFDINSKYSAIKLISGPAPSGSLYDGGGQAHLIGTAQVLNGYDGVITSCVSSLLASV
jgi:hypothetical protein